MEEESGEMHSEDDKGLLEKNKKRKVKTRAQVQALEKFYNEHKYPSEAMKLDVAESIGLTEKQVSGWFCHRRLKDKRLMNSENHATGKQDRSSGVIQDRASGHRQDSCGSTKLGEDRNFDTREVESGRELSAAEHLFELNAHKKGNYNRMDDDDDSSGSSSSLRNMSGHQNDDHIDLQSSRYLIPKFPSKGKGVKPRPGPSGYLKLKGQVENSAISAVKQQLGNHYRVDGPVLGVDFDPPPPGAFEPSMQEPVDETSFNGKAVLPAPTVVSKIHHQSKFGMAHEFIPSMGPHNSNLDGRSFRKQGNDDVPYHNNHTHKKFSQSNSAYYPPRDSSQELSQGSTRDISGNENRNDYGMWGRNNVERVVSVSSHHHHDRNARVEQEPRFHKYNDVSPKIPEGEYIGKSSSLTMKGYEHYNSFDRGQPRQITKMQDEPIYFQRKVNNENQIVAPFKSKTLAAKRIRDDFPPQQHMKRSSVVDNQTGSYPIMRSRGEVQPSSSEDEGSGETSSSAD